MGFVKIICCIVFTIFAYTSVANASPSETNYFSMFLKGEDAERFKNTKVTQNHYTYGDNDNHMSYNYSLSFIKEYKKSDVKFVFRIDCQQRVKNYSTSNAEFVAPMCDFVYFNGIIHTTIFMTPEIAKDMIKNLKWTKIRDWYYFGCNDNMDAGCPVINYYPESEKREAEVEILFFKP